MSVLYNIVKCQLGDHYEKSNCVLSEKAKKREGY